MFVGKTGEESGGLLSLQFTVAMLRHNCLPSLCKAGPAVSGCVRCVTVCVFSVLLSAPELLIRFYYHLH